MKMDNEPKRKMDNEPTGISAILLPLGMVACCGIPLLIFSGVLSGVGAWLADGGVAIIIGTALLAVGFVYLWRRLGKSQSIDPNVSNEPVDNRHNQ